MIRRLVLCLALAGLPRGQGEIERFSEVDPYTKGEPAALERAGYVSFGPFRFGDVHTTEQIETLLGGIPLLWVETPHFKLGSALPTYDIPRGDKDERERLRAELVELAKSIDGVKPKTKELDPWLRLHLHARRLENLYAEFLGHLGLKETDFPALALDPARARRPGDMGDGPYLGQRSKYTVLLLEKSSALARYTQVAFGTAFLQPQRQHFPKTGSLLFATATDLLEGDWRSDTGLTCYVQASVAQNLAEGLRGFRFQLPFWLVEGIGHWFRRQVSPRFHVFSNSDPATRQSRDQADWAPSVRARVRHGAFPTTEDMLAWSDPNALKWSDHLVLWSRIDYLMSADEGAFGRLLVHLKDPLGRRRSEDAIVRAREALHLATGMDPAEFDAGWAAWVEATYPKK